MRLSDFNLIEESFATAADVFGRSAPADEVTKYLDIFRDLNKRQRLKPEERDITQWIRAGWEPFVRFINAVRERQTGRETKAAQKKDSIVVHETDKLLVVIPLTKEASCFYGRETKWCTAATDEGKNHFNDYFGNKNVTLFYAIDKVHGERFAAAVHKVVQYYDEQDNAITEEDWTEWTGISQNQLYAWREQYKGNMAPHRDALASPEQAQTIVADYKRTVDVVVMTLRNILEHLSKVEITDGVRFAYEQKTKINFRHISNHYWQVREMMDRHGEDSKFAGYIKQAIEDSDIKENKNVAESLYRKIQQLIGFKD